MDKLIETLGGPMAQVVACCALVGMGGALLLAYMGKRDTALRDEMEAEYEPRFTALETKVAALERRCTEARAINAEAIHEASKLGPSGDRVCTLLVRQAAVLG